VRSLLALEPGAEGRIAIAGRDLLAARGAMLAALRRQVGLVFQDPAASLDPRWPVWRAVAEPLAVAGTGDAGTRRARSLAALAEVGLEAALAERRPHQLSGGQQQRVAIARALVLAPNLLVCDEPVSALDLAVQAGILNLLRDLRDRRGLAVLFVSHDLAAVRFVADRVLVLEAGRAVESGPVARVYAAPRHPATRALLDATPKALDAG
jgi:ABC-type dipeptide/oligopeptide/nickel transport system ATPase subunit